MVQNLKVKSQFLLLLPTSHPFSLPWGHHYHHFLSRNILCIYSVLYLVFPLNMSHRSFAWMYSDLITAQLTKVLFFMLSCAASRLVYLWGTPFLAGALSSLETAKLYSHQQCMRMPVSPRPCQYVLILLNQTGTLMRKA